MHVNVMSVYCPMCCYVTVHVCLYVFCYVLSVTYCTFMYRHSAKIFIRSKTRHIHSSTMFCMQFGYNDFEYHLYI